MIYLADVAFDKLSARNASWLSLVLKQNFGKHFFFRTRVGVIRRYYRVFDNIFQRILKIFSYLLPRENCCFNIYKHIYMTPGTV